MTNPFEDESGTFRVLRNDQGEYSLWPEFADVPRGWETLQSGQTRADALAYVEKYWTTLRPEHYAGRA